jgi:hypothetical protein
MLDKISILGCFNHIVIVRFHTSQKTTPKQFFQLQVLWIGSKLNLFISRSGFTLAKFNLIDSCVMEENFQKGFLLFTCFILPFGMEKFNRLRERNDVINKDKNLVSKAFVLEFISLFDYLDEHILY